MSALLFGILNSQAAGAPALPAHELIEEIDVTVQADSFIFSSIPQDYEHLVITGSMQAVANNNALVRFNGDSTLSYTYEEMWVDGGGQSSGWNDNTYIQCRYLWADDTRTYEYAPNEFIIWDYTKTDRSKNLFAQGGQLWDAASVAGFHVGQWSNTSAITSIEVIAINDVHPGTKVALWGIGKA